MEVLILKRLSDTQKNEIQAMRAEGLGYKAIADKLSLSRETVRSFCKRNHVPAGNTDTAVTDTASEMKQGNTVFIITTAYSENATETLEKKLEKLILNESAKLSGSYQFVQKSA
jgi:IS30 family transposase